MMSPSTLTPTQRHAAGALFGLALHQAQTHQTRHLGFPSDDLEDDSGLTQDRISGASSSSDSEGSHVWVNDSFDLLRPVFRFLEIDEDAWTGLEETSGSSPVNHHVGAFLRLLAEESSEASSEVAEKELAFSKGIDAMAANLEITPDDRELKKERQQEFEYQCREKLSNDDTSSENVKDETEIQERSAKTPIIEQHNEQDSSKYDEKHYVEEAALLSYSRKVTVLFEILSSCLAAGSKVDKTAKKRRKGYDSRHRVALRLLATWFDVKWIKVESSEIMVACSAMALLKEEESKEGKQSEESSWEKWKRGGIIGAAALTGGTLLAITGGLAAPAIAAGFGALAPTLGTIVPVIGAGGFTAIASAAGSVAGSVAVAASFGAAGAGLTGSKMARRIGDVEEFEFKPLGENRNQGVSFRFLVYSCVGGKFPGFVLKEEDFIKSWEGVHDNSERYALQWETKNLIALSTAIQDWLTSKIAKELITRGAMMTVLHGLLTAFAWPTTLLSATSFIDSIWTIAVDRCDKAGKILAEILMNGLQGNRPVTLVGFSLGARLIFKCLQVLSENKNCGGLVERVVLMGAPIAIKDVNWEAARKVVAGRFVNTYSTNDWMLAVAFRASLLTQGLAGIQPVDIPGVENVDVTEIIDGHSSYLWASPQILEQLQLDSPYPIFNGAVIIN